MTDAEKPETETTPRLHGTKPPFPKVEIPGIKKATLDPAPFSKAMEAVEKQLEAFTRSTLSIPKPLVPVKWDHHDSNPLQDLKDMSAKLGIPFPDKKKWEDDPTLLPKTLKSDDVQMLIIGILRQVEDMKVTIHPSELTNLQGWSIHQTTDELGRVTMWLENDNT